MDSSHAQNDFTVEDLDAMIIAMANTTKRWTSEKSHQGVLDMNSKELERINKLVNDEERSAQVGHGNLATNAQEKLTRRTKGKWKFSRLNVKGAPQLLIELGTVGDRVVVAMPPEARIAYYKNKRLTPLDSLPVVMTVNSRFVGVVDPSIHFNCIPTPSPLFALIQYVALKLSVTQKLNVVPHTPPTKDLREALQSLPPWDGEDTPMQNMLTQREEPMETSIMAKPQLHNDPPVATMASELFNLVPVEIMRMGSASLVDNTPVQYDGNQISVDAAHTFTAPVPRMFSPADGDRFDKNNLDPVGVMEAPEVDAVAQIGHDFQNESTPEPLVPPVSKSIIPGSSGSGNIGMDDAPMEDANTMVSLPEHNVSQDVTTQDVPVGHAGTEDNLDDSLVGQGPNQDIPPDDSARSEDGEMPTLSSQEKVDRLVEHVGEDLLDLLPDLVEDAFYSDDEVYDDDGRPIWWDLNLRVGTTMHNDDQLLELCIYLRSHRNKNFAPTFWFRAFQGLDTPVPRPELRNPLKTSAHFKGFVECWTLDEPFCFMTNKEQFKASVRYYFAHEAVSEQYEDWRIPVDGLNAKFLDDLTEACNTMAREKNRTDLVKDVPPRMTRPSMTPSSDFIEDETPEEPLEEEVDDEGNPFADGLQRKSLKSGKASSAMDFEMDSEQIYSLTASTAPSSRFTGRAARPRRRRLRRKPKSPNLPVALPNASMESELLSPERPRGRMGKTPKHIDPTADTGIDVLYTGRSNDDIIPSSPPVPISSTRMRAPPVRPPRTRDFTILEDAMEDVSISGEGQEDIGLSRGTKRTAPSPKTSRQGSHAGSSKRQRTGARNQDVARFGIWVTPRQPNNGNSPTPRRPFGEIDANIVVRPPPSTPSRGAKDKSIKLREISDRLSGLWKGRDGLRDEYSKADADRHQHTIDGNYTLVISMHEYLRTLDTQIEEMTKAIRRAQAELEEVVK
ncbi:hypothetical protein CC80DRAFT_531503 [Byssothecium circinans]|uniref:Uncharacterized protein n=1 Tax=Byssothecium circinans TaxID=147558 RepID=A0A6A5U901_9PLEO|nr:hypothetical protein CC80DRAFT_531503 [Byssothecium circinans]